MSIRPALPALAAALLFGASTPLAKLVGEVPALLLAGLLYLGSGLGLGVLLMARWARERVTGRTTTRLGIPRQEIGWLLGAILFGGLLGPALLMLGLTRASGLSASLLLNAT